MKKFDPIIHDPIEFDHYVLKKLRGRYSDILKLYKIELKKSKWFKSTILESDYKRYVDWNYIARFLISGFAAAEAFAIAPIDLMNIWILHTRWRVIPILAFNKSMDDYLTDKEKKNNFLKISIMNIASQLSGFSMIKNNKQYKIWSDIHTKFLCRVVEIAYEEVACRFNENYLQNPDKLILLYNTDRSPLLRSSTIETFITGISEITKYELKNIRWLRQYEKMRQLLDDLSDMRGDITEGRLTYPVLLALKSDEKNSNNKLKNIIKKHWRTQQKNEIIKFDQKSWFEIKNLIKTSSALTDISNMVIRWYNEIKFSIKNENFKGDVAALESLIDLKRAYLTRLLNNDLEDTPTTFNFFKD